MRAQCIFICTHGNEERKQRGAKRNVPLSTHRHTKVKLTGRARTWTGQWQVSREARKKPGNENEKIWFSQEEKKKRKKKERQK